MKSAIVTGSGAGIDESISKKLSENGYRVGMLGLNEDNVVNASKKIEKLVFCEFGNIWERLVAILIEAA